MTLLKMCFNEEAVEYLHWVFCILVHTTSICFKIHAGWTLPDNE